TQVWLLEFWPENVYFNRSGEKLLLDDNPAGKSRRILNKLKRGDHLIFYSVSRMVRYYAPLTVKRGKNNIKPDFKEYRIPSVYRTISLNNKNEFNNDIIAERTANYILFNSDNQKVSNRVKIEMSITGKKIASNKYEFTADWNIVMNEKKVGSGTKTSNEELKEIIRIFEDELHYYELNLNLCVGTNNNNANIEIIPSFKDTFVKD
ncbi:MAG: hypothetical protein HOD64_04190, partial [Candidatus Cloacimonetes bacterium]|nr:hypothetical protein [Candidatus Cloacimonadota bacterium]